MKTKKYQQSITTPPRQTAGKPRRYHIIASDPLLNQTPHTKASKIHSLQPSQSIKLEAVKREQKENKRRTNVVMRERIAGAVVAVNVLVLGKVRCG